MAARQEAALFSLMTSLCRAPILRWETDASMAKQGLAKIIVALAALLWGTGSAGQSAPPDLDAYAGRVLKEFQVPGLSIGIVKDGKIVVTKGYGVRKLNEQSLVDERTLFGIGSNTKAFTTAAL